HTHSDAVRRTRKSKNRGGDKRMLPIRKMTEKFARNSPLDADADVAKRVYYLTEGRMRVDYHFGTNRITNSSRSFTKDGQSQIVQTPWRRGRSPRLCWRSTARCW
ncbi:hypothetical protein Vretifemale_8361, partial [Volvox reticuliferus]